MSSFLKSHLLGVWAVDRDVGGGWGLGGQYLGPGRYNKVRGKFEEIASAVRGGDQPFASPPSNTPGYVQ